MRASEVFLDTAFAVALAIRSDQYHGRAASLAHEVRAQRIRFLTTHGVILEIGNMLSPVGFRSAGVQLIRSLLNDPQVEIVDHSARIFDDAWQMFGSHRDKNWGLVDCISFVVMRERGITDALTADRHFQQAGFRALLLEGDLE